MPLTPGTHLGPYEIVAPIGAGGMGEVYRAKDTKLGREVAIKVLPAAVAQDPERLARFEREARVLASLNHSSIAHLYGFESAALADGSSAHFLAMELVVGEDLSERLKRGAIPADEAIAIARQIAEALEEAHEKGIVHRDLKPANIKLSPDGKVKVLDFGLAKAYANDGEAGRASEISHSPTLTRQGTEAGMILGTAAYMSPEQARGKTVDKRADIWAFGVVFYEMLTGERLFAGETVSDVLAAVLRADVDWRTLPASLPAELRRLLGRCLERDPKNRLHDIADARIAIDETLRSPGAPADRLAGVHTQRSSRATLPWVVATFAILIALGMGLARSAANKEKTLRPPTAFGIQVQGSTFLTRIQSPLVSISSDGKTVLFVAEGQEGSSIYRRSLDRMTIQRVSGTEGAEDPLLSPDGRSIAYFASGMLRKTPFDGGTPVDVAEALAPRGAAFAPDGSIVYSPVYTSGLFRVSAAGGIPAQITTLDPSKERSHRWPHVLPDGKTVIFTVGAAGSPGSYDNADIDAVRLDTKERRTILKGARMARYTALGYLVFQRGETLLAARFDPSRLEFLGDPFSIHDGVSGDPSSGAGYFSVSDAGLVVTTLETSISRNRTLVLVDATGKETPLRIDPASYFHPRFSPDGNRIVVAIGTGSAADDDVFIYNLKGQGMQRLTFGGGYGMPIWTPDGRNVVYTMGRSGKLGIGMRAADGSGEERTLFSDAEQKLADDWHPDGKRLLVTDARGSVNIAILGPDGKLTPLFANKTSGESQATFSPDGRHVAYTSTETGKDEVIVETFPAGAGKWQVSTAGGGQSPVWSRDGRSLFFVSGQSIVAASVDASREFRHEAPRVLFTGRYDVRTVIQRDFDVAPDGRFVMVKRQAAETPGEFIVLEGWEQTDPGRKPR